MGYTSIDAVNVLFQTIKNSVLFSDINKPNGKLCKLERPLDSELEDVVINIITLGRDDVQEGVLNVNVFVPNLKFDDRKKDKAQPDTARLNYLLKLAITALGEGDEIWEPTGQYCFKLQQETVFPDENNQHYINIRVEFYSIN